MIKLFAPYCSGGRAESLFHAPSVTINTRCQGSAPNSRFLAPFYNGLRYTIMGQVPVLSCVEALLSVGCPPAILRGVWTVIVNAIQRAIFWTLSHVGVKISDVVPPFGYDDTTPAITIKRGMIRVVAALHHLMPYSVNRHLRQSVGGHRISVFSVCARFALCGGASSKQRPVYDFNDSTGALCVPFFVASVANHGPQAVGFASHINEFWIAGVRMRYNAVSHFSRFLTNLIRGRMLTHPLSFPQLYHQHSDKPRFQGATYV